MVAALLGKLAREQLVRGITRSQGELYRGKSVLPVKDELQTQQEI
jgi:hypothetical protein